MRDVTKVTAGTLLRLAQLWDVLDVGRAILFETRLGMQKQDDSIAANFQMTEAICRGNSRFFELLITYKAISLRDYLSLNKIRELYETVM